MYIRPLVNVHHVTVIMSYVQRKKRYHTDLLLLGSRLFKNTVLFCTKKKKITSHFNKMEKALASLVSKYLSPILSIMHNTLTSIENDPNPSMSVLTESTTML